LQWNARREGRASEQAYTFVGARLGQTELGGAGGPDTEARICEGGQFVIRAAGPRLGVKETQAVFCAAWGRVKSGYQFVVWTTEIQVVSNKTERGESGR